MAHAIYEIGVVFHKELHGDNDLIIWPPFSNSCDATLHSAPPELQLNLQLCLQIQMLSYYIWFWGSFLQWIQWWGVHDVLCNSWDKVWSPEPETIWSFCLQFSNPSTSWSVDHLIFSTLSSCHLHSSSSSSQPQHIFICNVTDLPSVVVPFHVPTSPTLLRLRNCCLTFLLFKFLQCFVVHVM